MSANTVPAATIADTTHFAAEDRYRVLVELAPFYLLEIGLDGTLLWANQAGLQLVGVSDVHAIAGVTFASIVGHSNQVQVDRWLLEAANGASCHFEFSSDGANQRHYKACLLPIKDAQDKVMRLMSVVEDITDRKQMELALTASEELFRTVADYTLDWEYWIGPQSRLLYMSPSCETITDLRGRSFLPILRCSRASRSRRTWPCWSVTNARSTATKTVRWNTASCTATAQCAGLNLDSSVDRLFSSVSPRNLQNSKTDEPCNCLDA